MPMNNLEAILFDLDGVIIDSEPLSNKKRCPLLTTMHAQAEHPLPDALKEMHWAQKGVS